MRRALLLLSLLCVAAITANSAAAATVTLDGVYFTTYQKPAGLSNGCPPNFAECGVFQLKGLGPADYVYAYGPTFEPNGTTGCFNEDGTLTITLQSDGSTITGSLTGVLCAPGKSAYGWYRKGGIKSYGNPYSEHLDVQFSGGTGQFAGLSGSGVFEQSAAGAAYRGTLTGTLN